jgi:hypothetical protein
MTYIPGATTRICIIPYELDQRLDWNGSIPFDGLDLTAFSN